MRVNIASCDLDEVLERGEFRCAASTLTERLGANLIGAAVYEMQAGDKQGPYHYHHWVEEWMYVVSGTPIRRDPDGERALEPGDLVALPSVRAAPTPSTAPAGSSSSQPARPAGARRLSPSIRTRTRSGRRLE